MGEVCCPTCKGTGKIPSNMKHPGMAIMGARIAMGKTQQECASAIGISRPQLANIETGRSNVGLDMIRPFAKYFGLEIEELIP